MVPDSKRQQDGAPREEVSLGTDGGEHPTPGFDEAVLYTVVRDAVKDALLDVIGTVLLVGIAFVLVIAGAQAVVSALSFGTVAVGVGVAAVGVYLAAATLEIIPPIRDWF
jgi:hypothetical protein